MKATYRDDSLIITADLCESRGASKEGLAFMRRFFPNGFTPKDVYEKKVRHVPMDYVIDGYYRLPFTENDKKLFLEYAQIVDSNPFYMCHHITNCKNISHSHHCYNSEEIEYGSDIESSSIVTHSSDIDNSQYVRNGQYVYGAKIVGDSTYVYDSESIIRSTEIHDSQGILDSTNVKDSKFLYGCENVTESLLCHKVTNAAQKILCNDIDGTTLEMPAICNRVVSEKVFNRVYLELKDILAEVKMIISSDAYTQDAYSLHALEHMLPSQSIFSKTFHSLELWSIIKDLIPNYDSTLAYLITFADQAL